VQADTLAYSNPIAEAEEQSTGGLTDFASLDFGPLDRDRRNPRTGGGDVTLPWRGRASTNVDCGPGLTNAFPGQPYAGDYPPQHIAFDETLGKDFGESISASLHATNRGMR
jgi:hypothetical protein